MQSFWLIFQLLFCLLIGYAFANKLPQKITQHSLKILPYFSYLLLIAIAYEFAEIFKSLETPHRLISTGIAIAFATSFGAFFCCYVLFKCVGQQPSSGRVSTELVIKSLLNISHAFICLALGYGLYQLTQQLHLDLHLSTWQMLLIFMFFIGLDLAQSPLDRSWFNVKILLVPLSCVIGSIVGVLIYGHFQTQLSTKDLILLSQGYGFYSMSSIVISELKYPELGTIALINDLFREIFAILLMYSLGWRYPRSAISSAGATAMDVTLPMVKQSCGNAYIPAAMVSGFVLSILAPIVISLLAAY